MKNLTPVKHCNLVKMVVLVFLLRRKTVDTLATVHMVIREKIVPPPSVHLVLVVHHQLTLPKV